MCGEWGRTNNMHQRKDWDGEGKDVMMKHKRAGDGDCPEYVFLLK